MALKSTPASANDDIFASGGCIDFQRTYVRNICQGTANISFPYLN